jgi:hypothetical protein
MPRINKRRRNNVSVGVAGQKNFSFFAANNLNKLVIIRPFSVFRRVFIDYLILFRSFNQHFHDLGFAKLHITKRLLLL